jgi:hypothetical protein
MDVSFEFGEDQYVYPRIPFAIHNLTFSPSLKGTNIFQVPDDPDSDESDDEQSLDNALEILHGTSAWTVPHNSKEAPKINQVDLTQDVTCTITSNRIDLTRRGNTVIDLTSVASEHADSIDLDEPLYEEPYDEDDHLPQEETVDNCLKYTGYSFDDDISTNMSTDSENYSQDQQSISTDNDSLDEDNGEEDEVEEGEDEEEEAEDDDEEEDEDEDFDRELDMETESVREGDNMMGVGALADMDGHTLLDSHGNIPPLAIPPYPRGFVNTNDGRWPPIATADPSIPQAYEELPPQLPAQRSGLAMPEHIIFPSTGLTPAEVGNKSPAELLGERSGKAQYFAAREQNKLVAQQQHHKATSIASILSPETSEGYGMRSILNDAPIPPLPPNYHAPLPTNNTFILPPVFTAEQAPPEPIPVAKASTSNAVALEMVTVQPAKLTKTPLAEMGSRFLNSPTGEELFASAERPSPELDMTSAFSFHMSKLAAMSDKPSSSENQPHPTCVKLPMCGSVPRVETPGIDRTPDPPVQEQDMQTEALGKKRKVDQMTTDALENQSEGELDMEKLIEERSAEIDALVGDRAVDEQAMIAEIIELSNKTVETPMEEAPKPKRLRRVAEAVGFVALGGAAAGVAFLSTLIVTAPTFT